MRGDGEVQTGFGNFHPYLPQGGLGGGKDVNNLITESIYLQQ